MHTDKTSVLLGAMDFSTFVSLFEFMASLPLSVLTLGYHKFGLFDSSSNLWLSCMRDFSLCALLSVSLLSSLFSLSASIYVIFSARERCESLLRVDCNEEQRRDTRIRGIQFTPFLKGARVKNMTNRGPTEHPSDYCVLYLYLCRCMECVR